MINIKNRFIFCIFILVILLIGCAEQANKEQEDDPKELGQVVTAGEKIGKDENDNDIYRVKVDDIYMGYKIIGNGKPLVLIMGLGGTMELWDQTFINGLARYYSVILFDNRGMGYSGPGNKEYSIEQLAVDVLGLMDQLNISKTNVLGYSMGANIALEIVSKHPERLDKLILNGTNVDGTSIAQNSSLSEVVDNLKNLNLPGVEPEVIDLQYEAVKQYKLPLEELNNINHEVMFLVGTFDDITPPEKSFEAAREIKGAWVVQIKDGRHYVVKDKPEECSAIILHFLMKALPY